MRGGRTAKGPVSPSSVVFLSMPCTAVVGSERDEAVAGRPIPFISSPVACFGTLPLISSKDIFSSRACVAEQQAGVQQLHEGTVSWPEHQGDSSVETRKVDEKTYSTQ
jgi:hypothetical protein